MTPTTPTTPAAPAGPAAAGGGRARPGGSRTGRLLRGPETQPAWLRPAVLALLAATAVLYLWGLGASAYANEFYAAAVQAGTLDWKALLFGSLDPANSITVDKPPASLWVMALSGRIFGFSSWSMLAPQAIEGVAAVGLLYAAVRRQAGPYAGLVAGGVLALTPVATLMFRFNNPDALLVLLLVAAAYAVVRGLENGRTRWFVLAGALVGFAFLAKMLQAFLVVPGLALVVLVAAPGSWYRRIGQLAASGAALVVAAGWYVALVELWPASSRPYIGGSTNNSLLELTLGYNGLSRITGGGAGGGPGGGGGPRGGGGPGGMFGGSAGLGRMFGSSFGTQISWLLPAAVIALVAGLVLSYVRPRAPRTDPARAGLVMWGGWLLVTGLVFSFMSGIIHPYYSVALAPAIGALVGIGGAGLWRRRDLTAARAVLAAMSAVTGVWAFVLLGRATWHPELRYAVVVVALLGAAALLVPARVAKRAAVTGLIAAVVAGLAAPAAYAVDTAATPHTGSTPTAGPSGSGGGFPGGRHRGFPGGQRFGQGQGQGQGRPSGNGEFPGNGRFPGNGERPGQGRQRSGDGEQGGARRGGGMPGGQRTFGGGETANSALTALLKKTSTRWAAATNGSMSSAPLQLASGKAVMAIGGFSGGDPSPTLARFKTYVADGEITYYVSGGMGGMGGGRGGHGGPGGSGSASAISSWVAAHYTAKTVGGQTVYDLTRPKG